MWAGDTSGVMLVACVQLWMVVVMCGFHGWWSLFAQCHVVCTFLSSLLGGCRGCCHSWTAGIVSGGRLDVTLHRGNVVAKQTWIVVG